MWHAFLSSNGDTTFRLASVWLATDTLLRIAVHSHRSPVVTSNVRLGVRINPPSDPFYLLSYPSLSYLTLSVVQFFEYRITLVQKCDPLLLEPPDFS